MGKSNAVTVLVLGICSIIVCGLLGPVAWSMGKTELARIDAGEVSPNERSMAQAGYICGIIGTSMVILGVVFLLLFLVSKPGP